MKNKFNEIENPALAFFETETKKENKNNNETKNTRISVLTYPEIKENLIKVTNIKSCSMNDLINDILNDYLENEETKKLLLKYDSIVNL